MRGTKVRLIGGPAHGRDVDANLGGVEWHVGQFELTPDGRRWIFYRYDAFTGRYLGVRR